MEASLSRGGELGFLPGGREEHLYGGSMVFEFCEADFFIPISMDSLVFVSQLFPAVVLHCRLFFSPIPRSRQFSKNPGSLAVP